MQISDINWGNESAEKDLNLLDYFVDSPELKRLSEKRKDIVVGRKGAGKSALLRKLEEIFKTKRSITVKITPDQHYIANIVNDQSTVNLFGKEIFFQYVWIRKIYTEIIFNLARNFGGKVHKFTRQNNITNKTLIDHVTDLSTSLKLKAGSLGEFGLTMEKEIIDSSNIVVLREVINQCILENEHKVDIIVLVDDLDLGWNNSEISNEVLKGLLSAASAIRIDHIFPIVFLRDDIYSILMSKIQHADKYRNIERIRWEKEKLIDVLRKRIDFNYIGAGIKFDNGEDLFYKIFPSTVGTSNCNNWLVERTLSRPRELIQFARIYTEMMTGDQPDPEVMKSAESEYSSMKLEDVCAEFSNQYPDLRKITDYWSSKLRRKKYHLKYNEIEEMFENIFENVSIDEDWYKNIVKTKNVRALLKIFYDVGIIGDFILGGAGGSKTYYSYEAGARNPTFDDIQVHPCFRSALDTVQRIRQAETPTNSSLL